MYHRPSDDAPVLFGDVFSSDWLFDAVLQEDALALEPIVLSKGRGRGYAPEGLRRARSDFLLAHGRSCRGILVSDDCEIETCLIRKSGKSRLLFAAVAPWPESPEEAEKAVERTTFRRHALPPGEGFDGGIVDLFRLFAVTGTALSEGGGRIICLADEARADLEQRWAAFATRRGPLAAVDNATKLAHLLDAHGDAPRLQLLRQRDALPGEQPQAIAKAVARTLTQGWRVEGEAMQRIADAHEEGRAGDDEATDLESELRHLAELAIRAADLLNEQLSRAG